MEQKRRPAAFGNLAPAAALAMAAVLLALGLAAVVYGARFYAARERQNVEIQGRILGSAVTAALTFDDRRAAQEYVNALDANPSVQVAAIYDQEGTRFVAYCRVTGHRFPETAPPIGSSMAHDRLVVVMPVKQDGRTLGYVYLETVVESFARQAVRYGLIALLITLTSLVVAVLGISQRALTKANTELERRAGELAAANQRLRVQIDETERIEAALRQSQKMEAIGQLTGGVAHDFNNLLQIILGSLEAIRRRSPRWGMTEDGARDLGRFMEAAVQGGQRAAALTHQLLAFSRRQSLVPKTIDVNTLVIGMSDLLRRTLGETIAIETVIAADMWTIYTDPNQLESAILNLAVNARDAMPEGGKLTIEAANAELDQARAYSEKDFISGQYVMIAVSDTGTGMSEDVLAQAFEPFFTTKDIGQGTGLGLPQVYGFIRQSDGYLDITSAPGIGTTVKLYLPRHLDVAEPDMPIRRELVPPAGSTVETILVVEDEHSVRAATVEMLRELGYTVFEAADGQAALEVLGREPQIQLLFTDIGLPGALNGRQLADEACRRRPDLKVLFATGYAKRAMGQKGLLDTGTAMLTKPFSYAALAEKVRFVLNEGVD